MRAGLLERLWRALHRATVRLLYPGRFRERFAAELDQCLGDQLSARREEGWLALCTVGANAVIRALLHAVGAWRQDRSSAAAPPTPPPRPEETRMHLALHELRLTLRRLRRSPSFVLLGIASLAIGVGANAAVLSILDGLLWRRLPVPEPEQLVRIAEVNEYGVRNSSYGNYQSLVEEAADVLDSVSLQRLETFAIETGDTIELAFGELVSSNYFETLRIEPALGRTFTRADAEAPTAPLVAVLSHDLWTRSFGSDPAVVGRTLRINDVPVVVAGVAPARFEGTKFALGMDLWLPVRPWGRAQGWGEWEADRGSASWNVIARLHDDTTREEAQAALDLLAGRLAEEHPESNASTRFRIFDERVARITPEAEGVLGLITAVAIAASILVLLVACANVGGLLLTRAADRAREIGLRSALGARRGRLVGEMLLDAALLALLGGGAGIALSWVTPQLVEGSLPALPYRFAIDIQPSPRVVGMALALVLSAVLLFALAPAWRAARVDPARALGARDGSPPTRGLDVVVVVMTAIAFLSLALGALFFRTLSAVREIDPGFETGGRLVASFDTALAGDPDLDDVDFARRLIDRVSALPGVESAAVSTLMPLGDSSNSSSVFAHDRAYREDEPGEHAWWASVTPGWLETAGTTLLEGRGLEADDDADRPRVAVINRALAERLWPEGDWIGRRLRFQRDPVGPSLEVVGVVENGRYEQANERQRSALFLSYAQAPRSAAVLLVRADGVDPIELAPEVREATRSVDPRIPLFAVKSVETHLIGSLWLFRTAAGFASVLGAMALLLATAGIYGVISHRVARRTRELGVRIAIGAGTRQLLTHVLGGGLLLCLTGVALGALLALFAGGAMSGVLIGVTARDPVIFGLVALALIVVSLLAALRPAARAARVDPVRSLRVD